MFPVVAALLILSIHTQAAQAMNGMHNGEGNIGEGNGQMNGMGNNPEINEDQPKVLKQARNAEVVPPSESTAAPTTEPTTQTTPTPTTEPTTQTTTTPTTQTTPTPTTEPTTQTTATPTTDATTVSANAQGPMVNSNVGQGAQSSSAESRNVQRAPDDHGAASNRGNNNGNNNNDGGNHGNGLGNNGESGGNDQGNNNKDQQTKHNAETNRGVSDQQPSNNEEVRGQAANGQRDRSPGDAVTDFGMGSSCTNSRNEPRRVILDSCCKAFVKWNVLVSVCPDGKVFATDICECIDKDSVDRTSCQRK